MPQLHQLRADGKCAAPRSETLSPKTNQRIVWTSLTFEAAGRLPLQGQNCECHLRYQSYGRDCPRGDGEVLGRGGQVARVRRDFPSALKFFIMARIVRTVSASLVPDSAPCKYLLRSSEASHFINSSSPMLSMFSQLSAIKPSCETRDLLRSSDSIVQICGRFPQQLA